MKGGRGGPRGPGRVERYLDHSELRSLGAGQFAVPFLLYFMLVTRSVTINVFASNTDERGSFKGCQGMSKAVSSYFELSKDFQTLRQG